jgi:hypothetical protein
MNAQPTTFSIAFTERVVFKDRMDNVLKVYEAGDVVKATADTGSYFVTSMGGIYHSEARRIGPEELITYEHIAGNGQSLFRQYAKDAVPAWGTNIRLEEEA